MGRWGLTFYKCPSLSYGWTLGPRIPLSLVCLQLDYKHHESKDLIFLISFHFRMSAIQTVKSEIWGREVTCSRSLGHTSLLTPVLVSQAPYTALLRRNKPCPFCSVPLGFTSQYRDAKAQQLNFANSDCLALLIHWAKTWGPLALGSRNDIYVVSEKQKQKQWLCSFQCSENTSSSCVLLFVFCCLQGLRWSSRPYIA